MKPHIAPKEIQPTDFAFNKANEAEITKILAKYPSNQKQSAVMPLLDLAQRQEGWISEVAMQEIASILEMPQIKVYEVATFYSMYHLAPVGKFHLQVCTTTPCWLCGSANLQKLIKDKIGISKNGEVSKDGVFSIEEVECLGACVNAPVVQVNDDYYEDLDAESLDGLLDSLSKGKVPTHGSVKGRVQSMPQGGPTVLKDLAKEVGFTPKASAKSAKSEAVAPAKKTPDNVAPKAAKAVEKDMTKNATKKTESKRVNSGKSVEPNDPKKASTATKKTTVKKTPTKPTTKKGK